MGKANKQEEAAKQIQEFFERGGYSVTPHKLALEDNQHWIILELNQRQVGIDSASGVGVRESIRHEWRCLTMLSTLEIKLFD
jgi:predicted RNA-binding protein with PUA domain